MAWKIRSRTEKDNHGKPKFWSDEVGWTWDDFSTTYTEEEKNTKLLPPNGEWVEVTFI